MNILAISGSARALSTNTALLKFMLRVAPEGMQLKVFHQLADLPVFSADAEGENTPAEVEAFMALVAEADALIISSPEYIRAIPGGLKNAIDWLVSGFAVIDKPIVLVHASHRGDDMLASLRLVLSTLSNNFVKQLFLRLPLVGKSLEDIDNYLEQAEQKATVVAFLCQFQTVITHLK